MWSTAREVAAGDTVIVWLTRDLIQHLVITPGKDFNTRYGNFKHSDFVGVPYGSKVVPKSGKGFVHILRPTPELWTLALPHRTQILYLADIALITSYLGIRNGSKVIEAGTGSASFSHSVARTVGSAGHLWSYEFHEARFNKAKSVQIDLVHPNRDFNVPAILFDRDEFARHGMDDIVTIQHRNVCKDGFTVANEADSVFLDLPAPWDAVDHAKKALRKDRNTRICCFSPCMEQVLRTVSALNEAGFTDIVMYETLLRPIEVFQTPQPPSVSVISDKLKESEAKREDKRLKQIAANKAGKGKRKRDEIGTSEFGDPSERIEAIDEVVQDNGEGLSVKRAKTEEAQPQDVTVIPMDVLEESTVSYPEVRPSSSGQRASSTPGPTVLHTKINVAKGLPEVRGHSSYLTFARLVPLESSTTAEAASKAETIVDDSMSVDDTATLSTVE